jgi:hypothetical protein
MNKSNPYSKFESALIDKKKKEREERREDMADEDKTASKLTDTDSKEYWASECRKLTKELENMSKHLALTEA